MEFTIRRQDLLEAAKSMLRVVPVSSGIKELEGFLLESDENAGELALTATNTESSIQRKLTASVGTGGGCVVNARLLSDMASLLPGNTVSFRNGGGGQLGVYSQSCAYTVPTLPAKNYPKPEIPFPEDTIKVSGLCDLYMRTAYSAAGKGVNDRPALTGVHLEIFSDCVKAVCCDGMRMAMAKKPSETGGRLSVTVPKMSLYHLAGAVKNEDVLEAGMYGKFLVFTKKGLLFSTRLFEDAYMDTDKLLESVNSDYTAKTDGKALSDAVEGLLVIADAAADYDGRKLNMRLSDGELCFSIRNDMCASSVSVPAALSGSAPAGGFWYDAARFADSSRTVHGEVELQISERGVVIFKSSDASYMLLPVQPPKAKAAEKPKKAAA
jgi:DNA polymerase-3 subunit beta